MSSIQPTHLRVIKVGGSLLTWPGLREALPNWLKSQTPGINLLLFGGGECVEAMRELDALWKLNAAAMHWRCVRLLDATFEIAQELWPHWPPLSACQFSCNSNRHKYLQSLPPHTNLTFIVQVSAIYTKDVSSLPCNWATTTDSIAAYFAQAIEANELILLKSTSPGIPQTIQQAAASGFVDTAFPNIAPTRMPIYTVDLTSPEATKSLLR